jgi:hypothetical protein
VAWARPSVDEIDGLFADRSMGEGAIPVPGGCTHQYCDASAPTDLGVIHRINDLELAVTNIATLLQQQSALLQNLMISTSAQPPKISKAQGKIRRAIAAALEWNNAQPEKFAVTQTLIQKATGSNMPAVRSVFEDPEIQSLIADHHQVIGFENNLKQSRNTLAILNWIQEQLANV